MNRWRGGAACICAILLLAAVASAQFPGMQGPPSFRGVWAPVVGAGAAYEMTGRRNDKSNMEIYIVGAETFEGTSGHWVEMAMNTREGEMVMKTFMGVRGKETAMLRMIMQPGGQEPMEFSMEMMGMMRRGQPTPSQKVDAREGATRVGTETITVPAGTFTCEHYKTADGDDFWVSDKVAPWGLVKATGKESSMTLTRVITGAKTKIRGTPRKFDMQEMMKRQQQ
jgi:hypothetical protein